MNNGLGWPLVVLLVSALIFCLIASGQIMNFTLAIRREEARTQRLRMNIETSEKSAGLLAADARAAHPATASLASALDRTAARAAAVRRPGAVVVPAGVKAGETTSKGVPGPWNPANRGD